MTEGTQAMTIRIPEPLHEQLRRLAFEAHKPMNEIVVKAIEQALNKKTA